MCDPNGKICSHIKEQLRSKGIEPDSDPINHTDMVLEIAECAAKNCAIKNSEYTTYEPYRSMGWGGFKEFAIKSILIRNKWIFVERSSRFDRSRFYRPK